MMLYLSVPCPHGIFSISIGSAGVPTLSRTMLGCGVAGLEVLGVLGPIVQHRGGLRLRLSTWKLLQLLAGPRLCCPPLQCSFWCARNVVRLRHVVDLSFIESLSIFWFSSPAVTVEPEAVLWRKQIIPFECKGQKKGVLPFFSNIVSFERRVWSMLGHCVGWLQREFEVLLPHAFERRYVLYPRSGENGKCHPAFGRLWDHESGISASNCFVIGLRYYRYWALLSGLSVWPFILCGKPKIRVSCGTVLLAFCTHEGLCQ